MMIAAMSSMALSPLRILAPKDFWLQPPSYPIQRVHNSYSPNPPTISPVPQRRKLIPNRESQVDLCNLYNKFFLPLVTHKCISSLSPLLVCVNCAHHGQARFNIKLLTCTLYQNKPSVVYSRSISGDLIL